MRGYVCTDMYLPGGKILSNQGMVEKNVKVSKLLPCFLLHKVVLYLQLLAEVTLHAIKINGGINRI